MSLKEAIGPELPYLRRYARAVTGAQALGDAAVRETLEALLEAPSEFDKDQPARLELYRIFHHLWHSDVSTPLALDGPVSHLSQRARQALLLTAVEGFSIAETALILGADSDEISVELETARVTITEHLKSNVMIIEDEAIIALHIQSIVKDLGHTVVGIARTRQDAVTLAQQTMPDLVLADISLADGSSGIDAVKDILESINVPVVFVTAFPERLLTGERPEPTYLITKPFEPAMLTATIAQALLVHREQHAANTEMAA